MYAGQELAPAVHALFADRLVPLASRPVVMRPAVTRAGDIYAFDDNRAPVEIMLGFRPGIDGIRITAGAPGVGAERILTCEEGGNAVVLDRRMRRIVLQGVALADLVPGDIAIA
jgi:hypothetical protein